MNKNTCNIDNATPFFIIGNPRSGTTLLRLMLNRHSEVVVPPECGFSMWLFPKYRESNFLDRTTINDFLTDVFKTRKFETWGLCKSELLNYLAKHKSLRYAEIVLLIYQYYAITQGKTPWLIGDKNNFYINHIKEIDLLFKKPKKVFIVRDGRDVACSYREMHSIDRSLKYAPQLSFDIADIAKEWNANTKVIIDSITSDPQRTYLVKYEELVSNPVTTLRGICDYLCIEFQDNMLKYYINNDEPKEFLPWKAKTQEPIDTTRIGTYKNMLTHEEALLFAHIAGENLDVLGYDTHEQ